MKTVRLSLLAAACLIAGIAAADAPPPRPPGPDMDRMAILLDLNDSQKVAVQKVLQEQHQKMLANRQQNQSSGTRPSREEMRQMHKQMKEETEAKLQSVLTPEQIKKFNALTERPPHHRREWGGDQAQPPSDSSVTGSD